jgi:tRNA A37 threonylcarbamoyladenosine modification protein TsaB
MILALRTDRPEAELHLLDVSGTEVATYSWEAHRTLAATLVGKIGEFLEENKSSTKELTGLIIFTGAGSFTGLRIGTTVANALAYSNQVPIVSGEGDEWIADGLKRLPDAKLEQYIIPTYDREPNITKPRS